MEESKKYPLLATCWLLFVWIFAYRGMLIAMLPSIASALSMTNTMVGSLVGVLWTSDALGAYPAGIATAYLSRKRILTISLLISAIFMLTFLSLSIFPAMLLCLFFAGLGFGSYYPIGVSLLTETFRGRKLGTMIGLHETGAPIGSTVGPFVASLLILSQFDWKFSLVLGLAAVPIIVLLLSVTIHQDHPMGGSRSVGFNTHSSSRYILIVAFAVCVVGLDAGLTSMIPVYMVDVLKVSNSETALVYGATRFFGVVGIIISGILSDRINKSTIIVIMVSLAALSGGAIALLPYNAFFVIALAILATAFSSYWPVLMTMMSEISSNENLPRVIGFQRLANGMLGGGLTPVVIGYLADISGFRTAFAYPIALGVLGVIIALALRTRRN